MIYNFSETCKLGDDFDNFVNEKWKKENPIPDDYSRWNNFIILGETTLFRLKEILDNTNEKNLSILWKKGNDENSLNNHKFTEIIKSVKTITDDYKIHKLLEYDISCPIKIHSYNDKKDSKTNILYINPGYLGLPDRDYYFVESMKEKRTEYLKFMKKVLIHSLIITEKDNDQLKELYDFELKLAESRLTCVELRNPHLTYNIFTYDELCNKFPCIDFKSIFENLKLPKDKKIVLSEPKYFEKLQNLSETKPDIFKLFLKWIALLDSLCYCDETTYNIYYEFYLKCLLGQKEKKVKWKQVLTVINSTLGEILGKIYVSKYFDEESKKLILEMTNRMLKQISKRIDKLDWMSSETKAKAQEKLKRFTVKIGYPDKWTNFNDLQLSDDLTYYENVLLCKKWHVSDNLKKCYKPMDPDEWHMNPQTINAYFNSSMNDIVFPAGILQEPFFSKKYEIGQNYGSVGAVICHEITHAFDDKGKLYDADGNLNKWWTDEDDKKFSEKVQILVSQFNNYKIDDTNVNGSLTLGENIADLGGLSIAYDSLMEYMNSDEKFTDELKLKQAKNLFYHWATVWRCNYNSEFLKNALLTDPHSPAFLRINGIVRNMDEFYETFKITKDDKLYIEPEKRAKIW